MLVAWKKKDSAEREAMLARLQEKLGWQPLERRLASWAEIAQLPENGIEIGSHGATHQLLTRLPEREGRREIELSRARIREEIGSAPRLFAYPNGDRDERVKSWTREAGYSFAFSIRGEPLDRFDIPRVNLHDGKMTDRKGRWSEARLVWSLGA
jgi:peptidoglycan/xylan/chitin deacetylase (PgdA/CDA1 family)